MNIAGSYIDREWCRRLSHTLSVAWHDVACWIARWTTIEEERITRLRSVAEITIQGIVGMLMAPMMKMQMTGLMHRLLEDPKHHVETGVPHPRKVMALAARKPIRA